MLKDFLSPPFSTFGTPQYSGEGAELLAARGESMQSVAPIACAWPI